MVSQTYLLKECLTTLNKNPAFKVKHDFYAIKLAELNTDLVVGSGVAEVEYEDEGNQLRVGDVYVNMTSDVDKIFLFEYLNSLFIKPQMFRGNLAYLSNMYECPIIVNGLRFRNAEAAFQASKLNCGLYTTRAKDFCNLTGIRAKEIGRQIPLRSDWEEVKELEMLKVVHAKFSQNKDLADRLLHDFYPLVELNSCGDTYWGVEERNGKYIGENKLGKCLMLVKAKLFCQRQDELKRIEQEVQESQHKLFTIGYAGYNINSFIKDLEANDIKHVLDVRSVPYSRVYKAFNKETLAVELRSRGITYGNYSEGFGARQQDQRYFTNGKLDFDKFRNSEAFKTEYETLIDVLSGATGLEGNVVLMCAEHDPLTCHRAIMVGKAFADVGHKIVHLGSNGYRETNAEFEQRLITHCSKLAGRKLTREEAYKFQANVIAYSK